MKNYAKPTLEIAKITTSEAIAAGSPVQITNIGTETGTDNVTVTVYELSYATSSAEEVNVG